MLLPRGFANFTEATLGFALSAAGEAIYLVNSNQTRVLDAILFEGQESGVSTGRAPDGGPGLYRLAAPTPGTTNSAAREKQIVINEIMYHPITDNENDEWVELFNRGPGAVDLGGWRFTAGIEFTIPSNTVVAANSYLVVAKNVSRLLSAYTNLQAANCVGNFSGSLRNSGERLALAMPDTIVSTNGGLAVTNLIDIVVDEVSYGQGGRWGQWADGGGSSLELMDARGDNRLPSNWADSDETGKAPWTTVSVTALLDNGGTTMPFRSEEHTSELQSPC